MRTALSALLWVFVCAASVQAQTNPCTAVPQAFTIVTDPSVGIVARLPDYGTILNQQPLWTEVELKVVPKGSSPTAQAVTNGTLTNPKSAWVLVPGTPDCYQVGVVGQFMFGVPQNQEVDLYARLKAGAVIGPWSTDFIPFARASLGAPTGLHRTP